MLIPEHLKTIFFCFKIHWESISDDFLSKIFYEILIITIACAPIDRYYCTIRTIVSNLLNLNSVLI